MTRSEKNYAATADEFEARSFLLRPSRRQRPLSSARIGLGQEKLAVGAAGARTAGWRRGPRAFRVALESGKGCAAAVS
jgi:hypothetical protein